MFTSNKTLLVVLSAIAVVVSLTGFWGILPGLVVLNWGINTLISYLRDREAGDTSERRLVFTILKVVAAAIIWLSGGVLSTLAVVAYLAWLSWKKGHKPGVFFSIGLLVGALLWPQAVVFFLALTALGHATGAFHKLIAHLRRRK